MSIPHLFRCPISLDLFADPVTLCTGQTYDRSSIEKWLAGGHSTCPVTMQRLHDTSLVPNRTLRHLIDRWLLSSSVPNSLETPGTASSLCILKQSLQSPHTSVPAKIAILSKIKILSDESDIGHASLVHLGYFPLLLHLLFHRTFESPQLVELGLECVLSLSDSSAQLETLNIIQKDPSNLASFLLLLDQGNVRIKTSMCHLLHTISTNNSTQELAAILGGSRRAMLAVTSLLHCRTDARAPEAAVQAISGLCSLECNRPNAIREGAVDGLISYVNSSAAKNCSTALATLEILAGSEEGKKALIKNFNAVKVLVKSVFRVSSAKDCEGSEHAVGALLIMCCESAKVRSEAVSGGVVTQVLLLLQSQCGSKAKAKGRALLKLLRSMWCRDPATGIHDGANFCVV